jgi:hypothetical protein
VFRVHLKKRVGSIRLHEHLGSKDLTRALNVHPNVSGAIQITQTGNSLIASASAANPA